jgi:cobalt-zinc-cadmium efflux system outer membrane protein
LSHSFSFALIVGATLFAIPLHAQETAPPVPPITSNNAATEPEITLEELLRLALQNNPQLPIARQNLEAARERVDANRGLDSPVLQVVPRLLGKREAADEEIIISQPLDVFGQKKARRRVFEAEVRRAESESTLAERSLVVSVKNAATELFAAQEAQTLGDVQVEVARLFRNAAARRAQLGDVPPVQVQRAELEVLRVENELEAARAERLARRAALNSFIGQAPETPLRVALPLSSELTILRPLDTTQRATSSTRTNGSGLEIPSSNIVGASSQSGSDLVTQRAELVAGTLARPDIVGAEATLEARRAQIRVLKRGRLPQVELQARRNTVTGSGGSTALRAVLSVPIFDLGSNKRERRALEAEARAQESQIVFLRSQAATQIEQALIRLQQQRATVERYRNGIVPLTLDLLRKSQIGYASGASTYLEVLEAQRTLRQVQTEYLQALIGTRLSEATLESAYGATLPATLIVNPSGAAAPPNVAEPGTVPENTIPSVESPPLNPPLSDLPATGETASGATASAQGGR